MAGQHWGERGNSDMPISIGEHIVVWGSIGLSILFVASQVWCVVEFLI